MAKKKLMKIEKLIGAFNDYIDSDSILSFEQYLGSTKKFSSSSQINESYFDSKSDKYAEFLNHLIENYDRVKGEKHKVLAIRQIRDEAIDSNTNLTIAADVNNLSGILAKHPIKKTGWRRTKYTARKSVKVLLLSLLATGAFCGVLGGFFGWGVGTLNLGFTGNVGRNLLLGSVLGSVLGGIIGTGTYLGISLARKHKIKKLGKKDSQNLTALKMTTLSNANEMEHMNIPLMELVHDFFEARQESKELRTSKNPFKKLRHMNLRDANNLRFNEITDSFKELIDKLNTSGYKTNAKFVEEYYLTKFRSFFTHPDFAKTANLKNIGSTSSRSAKHLSNKELNRRIVARETQALNTAFNFTTPKPNLTPAPVPSNPNQTIRKKFFSKILNSSNNHTATAGSTTTAGTTTSTTNKKNTTATPRKKTNTSVVTPTSTTQTKKNNTTSQTTTPSNTTTTTNKKNTTATPRKKTNTSVVAPTSTTQTKKNNTTSQTTTPSNTTTTQNKPAQTSTQTKKNTTTQTGATTGKASIDDIVIAAEKRILAMLVSKKSTTRKDIGVSDKSIDTIVKIAEDLHKGKSPISGKRQNERSLGSVIASKKYQDTFQVPVDDYNKIMDYAQKNLHIF